MLIERIARGDTVAFESLFRRYYPRVRRFLEKTTRRGQLIDEVLNDTMLVVWRKAGTFDLRSRASTWILGIALRRSLKASGRWEHAVTVEPADCTPSGAGDLEEHVFRQELRVRLDRVMKCLSPEHRAVVALTFFEGYSYREIAEIVGCPVDTVKTRMFHARRRLKVLLSDRRENAA